MFEWVNLCDKCFIATGVLTAIFFFSYAAYEFYRLMTKGLDEDETNNDDDCDGYKQYFPLGWDEF